VGELEAGAAVSVGAGIVAIGSQNVEYDSGDCVTRASVFMARFPTGVRFPETMSFLQVFRGAATTDPIPTVAAPLEHHLISSAPGDAV